MDMKLTKKVFKQILDNYVIEEKKYIAEHNKVKEILKPLEGREISGRLFNPKVLNGFKFETTVSMYYIIGEYRHLIGYNSENIISIEKSEHSRGFEYFDNCHGGAAMERVKQIENIDFEKAYKIFNGINETFNKLLLLFGEVDKNKLHAYHFPAYYSVLNTIHPDAQDFRLSNLFFHKLYK